MIDWDDFKYFTAVAGAGSVRGAAKALGVNASTVTRRLEQLERRLGARLFTRTRGGLFITPEGAEAVQALEGVARQLEDIERRLQGRDERVAGLVRINVPDVVAGDLLMAELGEFAAGHPQLVVEVTRSWRAPDLDRGEADLLLMLTDAPPEHLVGRPLGRVALAAYTRADGNGHSPAWLDSALQRAVAPEVGTTWFPGRRIAGYLESVDLQVAAAVSGMGATLLPCALADRDPGLRREPVAGEGPGELQRTLWLLFHPNSRGVARLQAVAELVLESLRRQLPQTEE